MNLEKYKFSEECEQDLNDFLKVVANQKPTDIKEVDLWKIILPKDLEISKKIDSFKNLLNDDGDYDVIEISDSEPILPDDCNNEISNEFCEQPSDNKLNPDTTAAQDLVDGVQELLETESILDKSIIKQISTSSLEYVFVHFAKVLNSEYALKLWNSIKTANCTEYYEVSSYFIEQILTEKIFHEHSDLVNMLFVDVFNVFPQEVASSLIKVLDGKEAKFDLTSFKNNLQCLSDDQKNKLLRTFENNTYKLTPNYLYMIQSLLTHSSSEVILLKIIDLMYRATKEFSSDKLFGKVLFQIVQTLGPNIVNSEQQLRYTVLNHHSVFKQKIEKLVEQFLPNQKLLSQSFLVL